MRKWRRTAEDRYGHLNSLQYANVLRARAKRAKERRQRNAARRIAQGKFLWRQRERELVRNYILLTMKFVHERHRMPSNGERKELMKAAVEDSGYVRESSGPRVLGLGRIQQAIDEAMNDAKLTVTDAALIMADIAKHGKMDSDRLRAVELRFKLTTGFAPAKSAVLHGHTRVDKLFDPRVFADTPPALPVDGQDDE